MDEVDAALDNTNIGKVHKISVYKITLIIFEDNFCNQFLFFKIKIGPSFPGGFKKLIKSKKEYWSLDTKWKAG